MTEVNNEVPDFHTEPPEQIESEDAQEEQEDIEMTDEPLKRIRDLDMSTFNLRNVVKTNIESIKKIQKSLEKKEKDLAKHNKKIAKMQQKLEQKELCILRKLEEKTEEHLGEIINLGKTIARHFSN